MTHSENESSFCKTVLSLPAGARVLRSGKVTDVASDRIAVVSNTGKLLVFPASDLPEMARGKGNKLMGIPSAKHATREEFVLAAVSVPAGSGLMLYCGQRHTTLKPADLNEYAGERGNRGGKLPRGFQKVDRVLIPGQQP